MHCHFNSRDHLPPAANCGQVKESARRLRELFDQPHNLGGPEEVVRRSKVCEVDLLAPGSVPGA